ncbi:MAG: class I tRNA ligase family protein, partial [bacterium]|nr:class I tRNA ligase family protein [bacterium]
YHRMKGDKTLWLPGADHAGFETQVVFDKKLEKEDRSRFQIPPDQLYKEILEFTLANKKIMEGQLKKLGASCDWSREKFTLDPKIIEIVYQTFERLKKDELLYKGERIVNWCVKHQTSLSDLEVKYEERNDPFYYIKYGPLELATVRLETKFGDTAVAVNPKDKRYQEYIGKEIEIETLLGKRKIKVIADEAVDIEFGTGAVKVTPAHDPDDFAIWQRHKAEIPPPLQVINKFGKLTAEAGPYQGMKVLEARKIIAEEMAKKGLLDPAKTDHAYKHNVAVCYKCGSVIEPMILQNQWFIKTTETPKSGGLSLRDLALKSVKQKEIEFVPQRFEKIFFHWMKNLRDWNISRQIVWGIKIPDETTSDVFDTWFSSGQWPFATLKTGQADDFKNFYPTDVMETGWDILFFWVARMIMLGIYATGKPPFKHVYLHGLVRDKERQKMSKSKGNVIDPLGVIDLYGSDALRMALVVGNTPGSDIVISEEKIRGYRNFANKVWNASRFVLMQLPDSKAQTGKLNLKSKKLTPSDKKILKSLAETNKLATKHIENFRFDLAADKLYHFFWHNFCDIYIEKFKFQKAKSQNVLLYVLLNSLKLLHPFLPFITEEIYQKMPLKDKKECMMIESWPK